MAIGTSKDTYIQYPDYIGSSEYENRCVTFSVLKTKTLGEGAESAKGKLKEMYNKVKDANLSTILGKSATTNKEFASAIETNFYKESAANTEFQIVLPLPNSFTDSQGHDWSTEKGIVGTMGGSLESKTVGDAASALPGIAGTIASTLASATGASSITASQALGAAANSSGMRKPLVDPGYFQNYTGSQPRTWSMEFDLVPSNPAEADAIYFIIMKLKEYSSPEVTVDGISLLAPHYFDIKISNDTLSSLAGLRGVVLTNISIDYGADGAMQFLPDGVPKYMKLSLSFTERKMMTAAMYREPVGKSK